MPFKKLQQLRYGRHEEGQDKPVGLG